MTRYFKSKIKMLKAPLLTLLIMLAVSNLIPLTAHAASDTGLSVNVEGEDFKVGEIVWDPNAQPNFKSPGHNATGWLVYLANTDGDIVSDIVYVHTSSTMPSTYITFLYARMSDGPLNDLRPIRFYTSAPWGAPWNGDETSRANEIRDWLNEVTEIEGVPVTNAVDAVYNYLQEDAFLTFLTDPNTYLVLEACANHEIIGGYKYGMYSTATAYGWIASEQLFGAHPATGFDDLGNSALIKNDSNPDNNNWDTSWVDHKLLQRSVQLSENWEGLPAAPIEGVNYKLGNSNRVLSKYEGLYGFEDLRNVGLGMLAVKAVNSSSTSTYDESLASNPGPAPNDTSKLTDEQKSDSTKHANIVKFYQTTNLITNTSTIDSYTRKVTPKTITIENETATTGYTIKEWFTSSSLTNVSNGSPSYTACKNNISNIQSGTTGGTVKLGDTETTLYLLLVKETGTPQPTPHPMGSPDFVLQESELTKPIPTLGTKLTNPTITYQLNLLDPCKGHCGGHCSNTDVPHDSDCVQCSVCESSGSWGSQCDGTLPNGSPCTNTGGGWGYGLCDDDDHGTATPCSDEDVKKGNCSHTQTTCTNPTHTTCGTFYE